MILKLVGLAAFFGVVSLSASYKITPSVIDGRSLILFKKCFCIFTLPCEYFN